MAKLRFLPATSNPFAPRCLAQIAMHTEYYTQPRLQKHVIRILLMVPIYAVDAWFALRFQKARSAGDPPLGPAGW
jgi:hypothetical protein